MSGSKKMSNPTVLPVNGPCDAFLINTQLAHVQGPSLHLIPPKNQEESMKLHRQKGTNTIFI